MLTARLYVLYDGKNVYTLSDQQRPGKFAGRRVKIVGTLDAKTKTICVRFDHRRKISRAVYRRVSWTDAVN